MIAASIDIGTNSVLLLVADLDGHNINALKEMESVPCLGKGVDENRTLHPDSQQRVLDVLNRYKRFLIENYPPIVDKTILTATSAVRDASNRSEFIDRVKKETGWDIHLLSGPQEAQTTFKGALSVLKEQKVRRSVVFDIGGGSTELAFGIGTSLKRSVSIDMGSVRFTERFFKSYPPEDTSVQSFRHTVQQLLTDNFSNEEDIELIGVAGTVTSLAAIFSGIEEYDSDKLNGVQLPQNIIKEYISSFSAMMPADIEATYPAFLTGRGEVILAGLLIMDEIISFFGKSEITVSTGGIRHGILLIN
ncbi:MAG: Ppx/GppA family phosphatase [Balneolaceae bacterium]|nr:MAG: Ppx/GppA family phosphatase [Balneolaceae bacterium]